MKEDETEGTRIQHDRQGMHKTLKFFCRKSSAEQAASLM
jgi:hypothetical protein